jgi:hypothetical protein
MMIAASIEDFQDIIKGLPQTMEIPTPGRPKRFTSIGLSIAAMAMSSLNAYRITQPNSEIMALKYKTDLLMDLSHLHEAHLHCLEDKTDVMSKLLNYMLEANFWFTSKLTNAIKKKFQAVEHHHENVVKLAQHHCLAPGTLPHNVLEKILNHTFTVAMK